MIAQLACGQRTNSEEKEGRHTVGHKVFPALHAEIRSDACDGGGEDKQEHMVDGVTDVQQKLCGPVMHPESSAKCRRFGREDVQAGRSEEHTSELQSLMRLSYVVFCLFRKIIYLIG